eukprot:CAMPEP_0114229218 /NCGR_PEP_ID=MMETSP0058-20121206/2786_1 /TAXON_ID=36894 /ORGANISM="Pyramimonas parkeae, CCMP726" /LENGTH=44 /DNA_ID= /DNA_START= /DNA_END= /DNA_ORIENTATION=
MPAFINIMLLFRLTVHPPVCASTKAQIENKFYPAKASELDPGTK